MARQDVETPSRPPKKRRALERADARHLAIWASDDGLPEAERERVQAERDRRKKLRPDKIVGVLVGLGGATPEQIERLQHALRSSLPTEVDHPFCPSRVHSVCRSACEQVAVWEGSPEVAAREVAQRSDVLLGLVNETSMPTDKSGVWAALRYAKDRGVEVQVIWPDGNLTTGRW